MVVFVLFVAALTVVALASDQVQIFHVPMAPGWPVVMAPDVPGSIQLSSGAVFTWTFPSSVQAQCTVNGVANSPCVGRVIDITFASVGTYGVTLTISDGASSKIVVKKDVQVFAADKFMTAQRPEVRQTSGAWYKQWVDAVYRIKELGIYDHFAAIHVNSFTIDNVQGSDRTAAHGGPAFLIWHRMTVKVVERTIATAAGDDTLGSPYWDWMKGWDGMQEFVGGDGDQTRNGILTNGPFCMDPAQNPSFTCPKRWQLPPNYPGDIKSLTRKIGNDPAFKFQTQDERDRLLAISDYDLPPFDASVHLGSFRSALEGWTQNYGYNHNGIHRYMGGTLLDVAQSFNDPLFLMHHTQVDNMLTMWQQKQKCDDGHGSPQCYRPGNVDPDVTASTPGVQQVNGGFKILGHMFKDVMYPWNITIQQMLVANQGYRFMDTNAKPQAPKLQRIDPTADPARLQNGTVVQPSQGKNNVYPVQGVPAAKPAKGSASKLASSFAIAALVTYVIIYS